MDRGERRRRDEVYANKLKRQCKTLLHHTQDRFELRVLGLRKDRLYRCSCSKKTPGRPKKAHGVCCWSSTEVSPKYARSRWRRHLDEEV